MEQLPDWPADCLPLLRSDGSYLTLEEIEGAAIDHALITCGSVTEAARRLGVPRSTFYRRLRVFYPAAFQADWYPTSIAHETRLPAPSRRQIELGTFLG